MTAIDLEAWVGSRGLGWAAVILLLFAAAFFFRELFEAGVIGPVGRVAIGVALGAVASVAGYFQHRKGRAITSQMLTAAGVILLYLSTFASFGYYTLLDSGPAGVFLIILVAEAFALALLYDAPAVAVMAVIGGLLNPVLLHSDRDRYVSFFAYLAVLNAGVVGVLLVRRWRVLSLLTLLGTHGLFWGWFFENYHPTKYWAAVIFHLTIVGLWLGQQLLGPILRYASINWEEAARLFVQNLLFAAAGYVLLDERAPQWMGTLALTFAIVHTALTWLVLERRPADGLHAMCEWSLAMGFLAAVVPLQAGTAWVAVLWAFQGLALWAFSFTARNFALRMMGLGFLVLGVQRFIFVSTMDKAAHDGPWPIFNPFALSGLGVAACAIFATLIARRKSPLPKIDFFLSRGIGLAGLFLIWVILSIEAYGYFEQQITGDPTVLGAQINANREDVQRLLGERNDFMARMAQVALSLTWGGYAIILLALGFWLPSRPLRWSALALFAITLAKVVFIDMENLPGLYRVAAFFGLSMMLGAAAWAYQRIKVSLLAEKEDHNVP